MTKQKASRIFAISLLAIGGIIAAVISVQLPVNETDQQVNGKPEVSTRGLEPKIQIAALTKPPTVLWEQQKTANLSSEAQPATPGLNVTSYDEQVIEQSEQQIQTLIEEYNNHLSDRKTREEIENQVAQIAQDYKQEVLLKVKQLNNKSR